ncbi:hypothetical protein KP509_11G051800 [Ceratopteris richardii]|uniref:Uncharacterized protein n=1 Tax=Ceratopteris richardii TaxID=49495 RepID=A0A8T2TUG0_CERRI|nr:hypothetical protein KP509_11G051800 [Ceratopteris richardii]
MGTFIAICSSLQTLQNADFVGSLVLRGEGRSCSLCHGSRSPRVLFRAFLRQEHIAFFNAAGLAAPVHHVTLRNLPSSRFPLRLPGRPAGRSNNTFGKKVYCHAITEIESFPSFLFHGAMEVLQQDPPTWTSSVASNALFLLFGFPLLRVGLTIPGMASAFLLGTLTWKAFGSHAFVLLILYFALGTGVTKLKIKQKEREGIAEKRSGKRGPSSVWGSGAAGIVCAIAAITGLGGSDLSYFWQLGFVASFATKLSDTISSEVGKAYGTTTYLVPSMKIVPRGTEGAVSLEGTLAGLSACIIFCAIAYNINEVTGRDALICVVASQVANLLESYLGATLQDRKGFEWLNNDVVNVVNISFGAILAIAASYASGVL